MKKTIETSIEINASAEKVWAILSDNTSYAQWNPFIRSLTGSFQKGNKIKVVLSSPDGGSFAFEPVILQAKFPEIRWLGKFLFKGLFDGEHYFRLEPTSSQTTRFVHGENFSGLLIAVMGSMLSKTQQGFQLMNEALKKKAEL